MQQIQVSTKRLDELSAQIVELDKRRIRDKEDILKQVADTAHEMRAMLSEFKVIMLTFKSIVLNHRQLLLAWQRNLTASDDDLLMQLNLLLTQTEFNIDKEERVLRENEMVKQLTDHENLVSSQYENQIVSKNFIPSWHLRKVCTIIMNMLLLYSAITGVTVSRGSWDAWRHHTVKRKRRRTVSEFFWKGNTSFTRQCDIWEQGKTILLFPAVASSCNALQFNMQLSLLSISSW